MLEQNPRVLDIGLSPLPLLMVSRYPGLRLTTLGYPDARFLRPNEWHHYDCDLADPAFPWDALGRHDLVIAAEVLEHLHTAPERLLHSIAQVLAPRGVLVLQTPNAAALDKRLKLLFGRNPREAGHLREYTLSELRALARETGYKVIETSVENYFRPSTLAGRAIGLVTPFLPRSMRDGITVMLSRR